MTLEKITTQIQAIEEEAGQLAEDDYEGLYKKLVKAYFLALDKIVLLENSTMQPSKVEELEDVIADLNLRLGVANTGVTELKSKLDKQDKFLNVYTAAIDDISKVAFGVMGDDLLTRQE